MPGLRAAGSQQGDDEPDTGAAHQREQGQPGDCRLLDLRAKLRQQPLLLLRRRRARANSELELALVGLWRRVL